MGYVYEYIDRLITHMNGRLPDGLADGEVGVGFFGGFEGGEHGVSVDEQVGHELIGYAATAQSVELSCRGRAHSVEVCNQVASRLFREVNVWNAGLLQCSRQYVSPAAVFPYVTG